jgi:soluble lytic murein transglycosylase
VNIPIARPSCGPEGLVMKFAGHFLRAAGVLLFFSLASFARTRPAAVPPGKAAPSEKQLEQLSRALKDKKAGSAYAQLGRFATRKSSGVLGNRAALALSYYDYTKGNYASAEKWLELAHGDPLLGDYVLYWSALTHIALGHDTQALAELQQLRADFPASVMTDQALQSLAETAVALNQPADAIAALDAYAATPEKPALLFLRAEAREQAGDPLQAAADYQAVYLHFPVTESARQAGLKLDILRESLGEKFPTIPPGQRLAHAAALFAAKDWSAARSEYVRLLPELSGADRERAELRILECGMAFGAGPAELSALKVENPEVDAERLYALAQYDRSVPLETEMIAAVEAAIARAPRSHWAEVALFLAGNYYWVQLDRDRAAAYYEKLLENFPSAPEADPAAWRIAWTSVLKRQPEAAEMMAEHLRRYPGSAFTPDTLYWLGRLAEEADNKALARTYYEKLSQRFPHNYFPELAAARLGVLGSGPVTEVDFLTVISPVPLVAPMSVVIPPAAAERQARADALRSMAFDSSAELELRAAYAATGEPRLLLEAAQAAVNAGHADAAIVAMRQLYPQLESRLFSDVPREAWLAAYPLPFEDAIRRWSARAGVDPMLVAGLIRQESAFQPEARSIANAMGLMQLLPKTARRLALQARIPYSRALLFDPDYNIRLGTLYLAGLRKDFGSLESALAAYNAGEEHVTAWKAGQPYREPAEFVDSIPFTETREYVEIVSRNAEIYRALYGVKNESRKTSARRSR